MCRSNHAGAALYCYRFESLSTMAGGLTGPRRHLRRASREFFPEWVTRMMKLQQVALVPICLLALHGPARADAPAVRWERRIDRAIPVAAQAKKDLLINFTAHGWCHWCVMFERDVFSHAEFAAAADNFVLVELDLPSAEDDAAKELHDLYQNWQKQYLARGVPVVVLADATGRPYGYTGYSIGLTPAAFLDQLDEYSAARQKRDTHLGRAKTLTGIERAQALHAALEAIRPLLGSIDQHQADPLLAFYGDFIDEIRRLDPDNAAGLRARYDKRKSDYRDWIAREETFRRINETKDRKAAIALIDQALSSAKDGESRWRLEWYRQTYLEWDTQYEAALENGRRLLRDPTITSQYYERIQDREAYDLFNLKRIDEGIASYDRRIADAVDHPDERVSLLHAKFLMLRNRGVPVLSRKACRDYRAALNPSSVDWENATNLLAEELKSAGRYREALAVREELLKHYREARKLLGDKPDVAQRIAGQLIAVAESQQTLGMNDEARQSLEEAERLIPPPGERHADKEAVLTLRKRLAELRKPVVAQN